MAQLVDRVTGMDKPTTRWGIGGTDLGIPYLNEAGDSVIYLFGDTFRYGPGSENWRSPVALHSNSDPKLGPIEWDDSLGGGIARQLTSYEHRPDELGPGVSRFGSEFTRIPNAGVSFAPGELGRGLPGTQYLSFHSVHAWPKGAPWRSNYSGWARSTNGGASFDVLPQGRRDNGRDNLDPFQMVSALKHPDGYVYLFSVRCGRQHGPMMLRRVRWDLLGSEGACEPWGWRDGRWAWGNPCTPILEGVFGEPGSVLLPDGRVVLMYLNLQGSPRIVSRVAKAPDGVWSPEKVQLDWRQQGSLYGGFPHPWSTADSLEFMVSTWDDRRYDVSHWRGRV